MTSKSELLAAFDAAWDHPWESLSEAIKGVTEEEAIYQHPAYASEPNEDGYPPKGTIFWHLVHLAYCYRRYRSGIERRPDPASNEITPTIVMTLAETIADVNIARDQLRDALENLSQDSLEEKLHYGMRVIDLARSSVRHDAWHAGQIAVARRLYRMREV